MSNMARFPPPASAGVPSPRLLARYRRDFKPELYPQKHGQEDQDRVQHDPHNVGSPTPSLLYSLLTHGAFSCGRKFYKWPAWSRYAQPATERMGRSLGQTRIVLNRDDRGGRKCPCSIDTGSRGPRRHRVFRTRLFIQLRPMLGRAPSVALQALAGVKPRPQPRQRSESL
jgi:hypothetical protein